MLALKSLAPNSIGVTGAEFAIIVGKVHRHLKASLPGSRPCANAPSHDDYVREAGGLSSARQAARCALGHAPRARLAVV